MSEKCRKIIYALVVTVFAAFLWMICCENDRKVSDKAIGETTVQSMRSGEKTVTARCTERENRPHGVTFPCIPFQSSSHA